MYEHVIQATMRVVVVLLLVGCKSMDLDQPTARCTYHAVTQRYEWPGGGWLHGFGFGDVNLDGKVDLLERAGVWTNVLSAKVDTSAHYDVRFGTDSANAKSGGSHMFAVDVDGESRHGRDLR